MLKTLIIDDEAPVREMLTRMISMYCPQMQVAGEAWSVESGLKAIQSVSPDVVLLDIQLGDGSGFDLLKEVKNINFRIIFVTAYEKYAVQAFKYAAVDYILKPVDPEELKAAAVNAENLSYQHFNSQLDVLEQNLSNNPQGKKKIVIKTQENIYLVAIPDIIHFESDGCYTTIFTLEGEKIIVSKILKDYEEMLSSDGFYRVHKSYLVNFAHIRRFDRREGGILFLTGNYQIPVATRKREELMYLFEKLSH